MSINQLFEIITREGYTARIVSVFTGEDETPGIMVTHNYSGLYPSAETWETFYRIKKLARAAGYDSEARGYFTASLIF